MKCKRCQAKAEVQLRAHNTAFCRACFILYFERQVERTIARHRMLPPNGRVLVAVSGGKDSLALWHVLAAQGYDTTGLHLSLGIGDYSAHSRAKTEAFARAHALPLIVEDLNDNDIGIPMVAGFTNRPPCAACGTIKRHSFDGAALRHAFPVVATGHNLDDEAARLLGNVLHWQREYLAKQHPVLAPTHPKFATKIRPLYLLSEFETAVYAFFRGIDYVVDECPNSVGATQLDYKAVLNDLEERMPGTKQAFVREYVRVGHPAFAAAPPDAAGPAGECTVCGMPAFGTICSYCSLIREVRSKRERRRATA